MTDLAAAYALVPKVECKGLCADFCGPIACSAAEADAMRDDGVIPPGLRRHPKHGTVCSHLTDGDRCAVYAHRPMICRLFGAVHRLRCPHGCKPAGGYLDDEQAGALIRKVDDGRPPHRSLPPGVGLSTAP